MKQYETSGLIPGQLGPIVHSVDNILAGFEYCLVDDNGYWMPRFQCQVVGVLGYKFVDNLADEENSLTVEFTPEEMEAYVAAGKLAICF